MALLDLYVQTTGDNLNAGTDFGATPTAIPSASYSVTSGTITFTGAANAFSLAGATVGTWVSFYNSTDSVSRFLGKIDTTDGTTITVLYTSGSGYSTTGLGIATGLTTGTIYCRIGGAWASLAITNTGGSLNAPSLSGAITGSIYNGVRVNIKSGTYLNTAAIQLPSGTAGKPIIWRGYYATAGDLDNFANVNGVMVGPTGTTLSGASRPIISSNVNSTTAMAAGGFSWFENLEFTNSTGNNSINLSGGTAGHVRLHRCRFGTGTTNGSFAANNSQFHATGCYFGGTFGSNGAYQVAYGNYQGCVFRNGIASNTISNIVVNYCVFDTIVGALAIGGASCSITNNVFYKCPTAITLATTATYPLIENNIFSECTTAINNLMSNPWTANLVNNDYHNNTNSVTPTWEGFQRGNVSENALPYSPFSDKANHDFSLAADAKARQAGFPGQLEV